MLHKKHLEQNERTQKREMNEKKCIIITHLRLFKIERTTADGLK